MPSAHLEFYRSVSTAVKLRNTSHAHKSERVSKQLVCTLMFNNIVDHDATLS